MLSSQGVTRLVSQLFSGQKKPEPMSTLQTMEGGAAQQRQQMPEDYTPVSDDGGSGISAKELQTLMAYLLGKTGEAE